MKKTNSELPYLGLFTALAALLGYIETLIPVFAGIPRMKLGLANLAVLFCLIRYSYKEAAFVSITRVLIVGFLFGNTFGIIYSLAGAVLSLIVMALLHQKTMCSTVMISMCGGISHNLGQLLIAMLIAENTALIYYAPALLISGVLTGLLIGIVTEETLKRIRF